MCCNVYFWPWFSWRTVDYLTLSPEIWTSWSDMWKYFLKKHTQKKWRYEHCVQVKWLTAAPAWLTQTNAHRTNISKGDTGTWQNWQPHYAAHWWVGDWTVCFSFLNKVTEIKFEMSTSSMGFMLKYVIHFWEECSQY